MPHCSLLAKRMRDAIIAAIAQTTAARTKMTPARKPVAKSELTGLVPWLKLSVLTKPKQEPPPSRIPPTRVIRMGLRWNAGGREGDGGGGDRCGVVNGSPSVESRAAASQR